MRKGSGYYVDTAGDIREAQTNTLTPAGEIQHLRNAIQLAMQALEEHGEGLGSLIAHSILFCALEAE